MTAKELDNIVTRLESARQHKKQIQLTKAQAEIDTINRCAEAYFDGLYDAIKEVKNAPQEEQAKPLSAFLAPVDLYKGLKRKYLVFKADSGEMVENCFVLRPDKDPAAVEALKAYAKATDNEELAADIYKWVGTEGA